jgi:hypothetical protein
MKTHGAGAELFLLMDEQTYVQTDRQTDRYDAASSSFSQCANAARNGN